MKTFVMRKRFEQSPELDFCPISEVQINTKTRHQLAPLLIALQYIFIDTDLSEQVFSILEKKILQSKKNTGRLGMTMWEILVLGVVRLNLDIDYDFLLDHANNHNELRGVLGVQTKKVFFEGQKEYKYQTMVDNVSLLDADLIAQINVVLVKAGHSILKKKENEEVLHLEIKSDSYAVESNIHFPTDINLSWDSARKIFDTIEKILTEDRVVISGWRKYKSIRSKVKKLYRGVSNIHAKKGANYHHRLRISVIKLLDLYQLILQRVQLSLIEIKSTTTLKVIILGDVLSGYQKYLAKFTDQLDRRILQGEKIPHSEKMFSIFEPQVEWLQKGKQNNKVELGHNVLVTTDQYHLILDYKVMFKQRDNSQPLALVERLNERYNSGYHMKSISFDRGFYSKLSKEGLKKKFDTVVMPTKGKSTTATKEEESEKSFKNLMDRHSAVESNINELEHSGVNKVPDRGQEGFERYVGLGVLAYNLKRIGRLLIEPKKKRKNRNGQRSRAA